MRETSDLNPKYVAYFAIALIVGAIVVLGGAAWIFKTFVAREQREDVSRIQVEPVPTASRTPRLQIDPQKDDREYLAAQRETLNQYGWVDRDRGVARIPIDRAMDLIAQEGRK